MALAPSTVGTAERDATIRLVAAHRSGDPDAFAELVRDHYAPLLALARRRLGSEADAEDAVQDTLLRAYRGLHRFGMTGDWRLGAWLTRILVNVCHEAPKRRLPTVPLPERDDIAEPGFASARTDVADLVSDHVALAAVQRAIGTLPASQADAFLLRAVSDLPYEEVAGMLGITEDNARARVTRARSALRKRLEGSAAITGLAGALAGIGTSVRATLRRALWGPTQYPGGQALQGGGAGAGTSATSCLGTGPVGTGMQLLGQVSAAPVTQAAIAASTASGGRTSVVLGLVASLATAGGLSVPALSATTAAAPSRSISTAAVITTAALPYPGGTTVTPAAPATPTAPSAPATATSPAAVATTPSWVTSARSAAVYTAPPAPSAPASVPSTPGPRTPAPSAATTAPAPTPPGAVILPPGACSGVTGFPGVSAPATVPAVGSSLLGAILSTVALPLSGSPASPAFAGTGTLTAGGGLPSADGIDVGTCLEAGGSLLAVDMKGPTGVEVQLVGSLVAAPTVSTGATGTATGGDVVYVFRGSATQVAGPVGADGVLPWHLQPNFVAEVVVQPSSRTASLTVVFLRPTPTSTSTSATPAQAPSGTTSNGSGAASTPTTAAPSASSTPAPGGLTASTTGTPAAEG